MARQDTIGFKTTKRTGGGHKGPTNREILLELRSDVKDLKTRVSNIEVELLRLKKDNNLK